MKIKKQLINYIWEIKKIEMIFYNIPISIKDKYKHKKYDKHYYY